MKVSEALRKAQQDGVKQIIGNYLCHGEHGEVCACAAGAVAYEEDIAGDDKHWFLVNTIRLRELYQNFNNPIPHPFRGGDWDLLELLVDLNDGRGWTFDQIAEYLESKDL